MTSLVGRGVRVFIGEPFQHGRAGIEVRGLIAGQIRSSTGLLLLVTSEAGTILLAPRHAGMTLEDLRLGRLTVHVARTSREIEDGESIADREIESVGSGVAWLDAEIDSPLGSQGGGR
jgi:hypothetical protein